MPGQVGFARRKKESQREVFNQLIVNFAGGKGVPLFGFGTHPPDVGAVQQLDRVVGVNVIAFEGVGRNGLLRRCRFLYHHFRFGFVIIAGIGDGGGLGIGVNRHSRRLRRAAIARQPAQHCRRHKPGRGLLRRQPVNGLRCQQPTG